MFDLPLFLAAKSDVPLIRLSTYNLIPLLCGLGIVVFLAIIGRVPLRYNFRNLSVRWIATFMTALAFTLVIGLMTMMLAFINGMVKLTQQSGQPENVMILSDGTTDEAFSNLGFSDLGDIEFQDGISRDEVSNSPLASRETYIVANQLVDNPRAGRPPRRLVQVRGIDDPVISGKVHKLTLLDGGQWFTQEGVVSEGDDKLASIQAVIGEGIARELGRDRLPEAIAAAKNKERLDVGETFTLAERKWYIVGVVKATGGTFDSEIWAKRDVIGPIFGENTYSTITLRTADAAKAKTVTDFFNNDYKKAAVRAFLETSYFENLAVNNQQFLVVTIVLTGIIAIGGVMGVMNTMFAAVSQRSKDIGVLRILGFSRLEILCSFLLESLVLALIGGGIGCIVGSLIHGQRATSVISGGQTQKFVVIEMIITGDTIGIGLIVTLAMGLLGGFIPAFFAMLVKPLESLR